VGRIPLSVLEHLLFHFTFKFNQDRQVCHFRILAHRFIDSPYLTVQIGPVDSYGNVSTCVISWAI